MEKVGQEAAQLRQGTQEAIELALARKRKQSELPSADSSSDDDDKRLSPYACILPQPYSADLCPPPPPPQSQPHF